MMDVNASVEVVNLETMLEHLESEQKRPYHNSFLDLNEPEMMNKQDYDHLQYKRYAYAVEKMDDSY